MRLFTAELQDDEGETNKCSEIDKRLGLVPSPSEEDRDAQTSIIGLCFFNLSSILKY